ncbi:MAG: maleylacetoacetate isomerase [Gammaproteobacteria bacterium RIFCSPHIGHO2_12_FULL_37_14]|nr:MAG: maleylacetoacetate isomerase [Gammaproteobacteria bacterium RIFCSPHIGHO2_12_FULL_37_14]
MKKLKLYDYYRSSACFRVRIALELKNLDYQLVPIHLVKNGGEQYSDSYQMINPQSLVPTLQDNNQIITQSLAIIDYLEEKYQKPSLLSSDLYIKALIKSFALTIVADIHPLNNLRVLNYLTNELNITEEMKTQWYHHWVTKGFSALEKQLNSTKLHRDFCFGDYPTLADICLVPQMYNARRFNIDLSTYETLVRIDKFCQQHPAFMKAWPEEKMT